MDFLYKRKNRKGRKPKVKMKTLKTNKTLVPIRCNCLKIMEVVKSKPAANPKKYFAFSLKSWLAFNFNWWMVRRGRKTKPKPSVPVIKRWNPAGQCIILKSTDNKVIELKSAPEMYTANLILTGFIKFIINCC